MDDEIQGEAVELGDLKPLNGKQPGTFLRSKTCSSCGYGVKEKGDLVCRNMPPQCTFIAVPFQQMVPTPRGPQAQTGMRIQNFSGFPGVQPDQWCGKWEAKRTA